MPVKLSPAIQELLKTPVYASLVTLLRDGTPHQTQVWIDTDGTHVLVNTVEGYQKLVNMRRDPRVSVLVRPEEDPARWVSICGEVVEISTEGAREHVETLSWRYTGKPYAMHGLGQRVLVKIAPTRIYDSLERRGAVNSRAGAGTAAGQNRDAGDGAGTGAPVGD